MTTETLPAIDVRAHLKMLFSMNHSLLTRNLDGVSESVALARPGDGNAIAWSVGHVVYWRQAMIGMLGGAPVWADGYAEGFKGTSRALPATIDRPWPELLDAYRESHRLLIEALQQAAEPTAEIVKGLAQLQCHETYHIGQIALARRVAGLPGVI